MLEAIVHIGAGKCGSSAIQASLSTAPQFANRSGANFRYIVTDGQFRVLPGRKIADRAALVRSGYVTSPNPRRLRQVTEDRWSALSASLRSDAAKDRVLILSNEGYFLTPWAFTEARVFERLDTTATVLAYVRPQVDYLNSAWWQWGAWTGDEFDEWLQKRLGRAFWARQIARWLDVPGVHKLIVRPLPKDVISDFYECVLDADVPPEIWRRTVNRSLSATTLRVLQRHPHLRRTNGTEFLLETSLPSAGRPPWVIDQERAKKIVSRCKEDNLRLLSMMDQDSRAVVESDPRWWDAAAYAERPAEPAHAIDPRDEDLDQVAADLIQALISLDIKGRGAAGPPDANHGT